MNKKTRAKHNLAPKLPFFYDIGLTNDLAKQAYNLLPPSTDKVLPDKWFWKSPEHFVDKYGDLGYVVWSRQFSYHALFIGGNPVLRIWTAKPNKARVEVNRVLYETAGHVLDVPAKMKQTKWYWGQLQVTKPEEITTIINKVKEIYGV
jgi:hypothetical protein